MDKTYVVNGCSNHSNNEREQNDYYATPFVATEKLLEVEKFSNKIYEPFVGGGHIATVLEDNGYKVRGSDIIDRGYHDTEIIDFLNCKDEPVDADIISNPPYKYVADCWAKACERITEGHKVAYMLKLTFLEGKARKELFKKYPPTRVHVFSERITCALNGEFDKYKVSAIAHAWFVYEKGNKNLPLIDWI